MARNTPTIRAGTLTLHTFTSGDHTEIPAESDAWFAWLETARTFAFEDPSGRFTARKKRRWEMEYWYAFRRRGGRFYETYLGKARDVTLGRLRAAAIRLNQLAGRTVQLQSAFLTSTQPGQAGDSMVSGAYHSSAKFSASQAQLPQLVHTRALDRLGQAPECPLTVVSAPAGYGKTTLLIQWIVASRLPTAWVSLNESDNDPARFWAHVSAALEQLTPGLFEATRPPADARGPRHSYVTFTAIMAALSMVPSPTVLVLDDYHELRNDNDRIHGTVAHLVEHLPPQTHLVVAARSVPPLPLGKLRAHRQLIELHAADLQFTPEETRSFLTERMRLDLSDDEVAILQDRTEGWAVGLQLAALSLQEQADRHGWVTRFSGEDQYIFDYLVEQVVNHLPPAVRSFVLQTALLDRLCASLCDAVTQTNTSQEILEELERANLFLASLDDRREWYRFHHLFVEVVRRYIHQTQGEIAPDLYARASAWCEAHALMLDAIDYAFAANALERAAQLLEVYASTALTRGYQMLLRDRLERLPDEFIRERPRLSIAHAYTLYIAEERVLWRQRVRDAEEAIARSAHLFEPSARAVLEGELAALRATVAAHHQPSAVSSRDLIVSFQRVLAALPLNQASQMPQKLTVRERQVLLLIAGGASNNDIARELVISPATAKRHVSNIYMKLGAQRRTQAVARAREFHLLGSEAQNQASEAGWSSPE